MTINELVYVLKKFWDQEIPIKTDDDREISAVVVSTRFTGTSKVTKIYLEVEKAD